jgi:hypothetical protein
MTAARLWGWYHTRYEPLPFMGDSGYLRVVQGLLNADEPALSVSGRRAGEGVDYTSTIELLPLGERLLRNEADWLASNPAERWVGGVRIDAHERLNWRFSEDQCGVYR